MYYKTTRRVLCVMLGLMLAGLLCFTPAHAKDIEVTFQWDPDTTDNWESILLFERVEAGAYDYNTPAATIPQTYDAQGNSQPVTYLHTFEAPEGNVTQFYWVVRAKAGELESADSEEVNLAIDLTPIPAPTFTAAFNEVEMSIDFSWTTDLDARITSWKIFHKLPADADFTELVTVDSSGSESVPIDTLFPDGERTTREFTMVAYGPYELFSDNGQSISITVNRKPPSGVINFRIKLTP